MLSAASINHLLPCDRDHEPPQITAILMRIETSRFRTFDHISQNAKGDILFVRSSLRVVVHALSRFIYYHVEVGIPDTPGGRIVTCFELIEESRDIALVRSHVNCLLTLVRSYP